MIIHNDSELVADVLPGISHRTLAGPEHGLRQLEVWSQSIVPGSATPPHRHDCEEVVLVLAGEGTVTMAGESRTVRQGDTLILPANVLHQIINTGSAPLRTLAALAMSPVRVELPDGTPLALPWHAGRQQHGG